VAGLDDDLRQRVERYRLRVEAALDRRLPPASLAPTRLHEAMRYAVLGPGKRVRPILCYLTGEVVGVDPAQLDGPAAAVEIIHAYSLVHDDLPAMDDDDLRRGRPTTHRAFDEATAVLAGDALQVLAFEILATDPSMVDSPASRLAVIRVLAQASGTAGMAGGQAMDLGAVGGRLSLPEVEEMHRRKTGALIEASVLMAADSRPGLPPQRREALARYASALGLSFQIVDDLLDVEGEAAVVGKPVRADAASAKPTFPAVAGVPAAHARVDALCTESLAALEGFGAEADGLRELARYVATRRH
jgi:farnesyl diphosphate synthase